MTQEITLLVFLVKPLRFLHQKTVVFLPPVGTKNEFYINEKKSPMGFSTIIYVILDE